MLFCGDVAISGKYNNVDFAYINKTGKEVIDLSLNK